MRWPSIARTRAGAGGVHPPNPSASDSLPEPPGLRSSQDLSRGRARRRVSEALVGDAPIRRHLSTIVSRAGMQQNGASPDARAVA